MQYLSLIIENWGTIVQGAASVASGVVTLMTIANMLMPKVITSEKLAKVEAITSKFSVGTKRAEIVKK